MRHRRGFSIWEMVVLGVIAVVVVALGLGASLRIGCGHPVNRQMQNSTQVRGIHSGLVLYAQGNNTYFPGISSGGTVAAGDAATVGRRLQTLVMENYFTGEYIISPSETKTIWTSGTVTTANFSYAMLSLMDTSGTRTQEWRDTINTEAVVLGDRNAGQDDGGAFSAETVQSIHVPNAGEWRGSVGWNDNHVTWETAHETSINTRYGWYGEVGAKHLGSPVIDDNLFADDNDDAGQSGNDALLEYTSD